MLTFLDLAVMGLTASPRPLNERDGLLNLRQAPTNNSLPGTAAIKAAFASPRTGSAAVAPDQFQPLRLQRMMSLSAQLLKLGAVIIYQTRLHMPANSAQGIVEGVGCIMAPVDGGRS